MTDTNTDTAAETATNSTTIDTSTTDGTETAAELEKWKALSKKNEIRAAANAAAAKELDALKRSSMSDTEKAVAQAKVEARIEALREVGGRLAESAIRVAAAGRNVDVDALLEGVDASKFLDADGEPDTAAIGKWVDRVAPPVEETERPALRRDLGVGVRGQSTPLNGDPLLRDLKAKLGM